MRQVIQPALELLGLSVFLMLIIRKKLETIPEMPLRTGRLILITSYTALFLSASAVFYTLPVKGYIEAVERQKLPPKDSAFYRKYYVNPNNTQIVFPQKKKNLVFILMESMESSFADKRSGGVFDENHIPELTRMANENINFSHTQLMGGGKDLFGTHWTIAAMISKLCGIPFNIPIEGNTNFSVDFLPGAKGLTDILSENGYKQRFLFGSDKRFASRGRFMETHKVEVHDLIYYKQRKKVPQDYYVFWGIEDAKLFALAKEELDEAAEMGSPFMLGLLTADTHFPGGYICELCDKNHDNTEQSKARTVFRCASRQIDDFIKWMRSKPWYNDTVIVIVGDHLYMSDKAFPKQTAEKSRRWLNIFINSSVMAEHSKRRDFSSFDMYPTILESMGVKIQGHALGLGRSLFSQRPTILEEIQEEDYINNELSLQNIQYNEFIYGSK